MNDRVGVRRDTNRPSEVLHTVADKRAPGTGLPREKNSRRRLLPPRPPAVWGRKPAEIFHPAPIYGQYPRGFVAWALRAIHCNRTDVLHLCSGALGSDVGGLRIDLRTSAYPDVIADARRLPFRSNSFAGALIDPPYSVEYAKDLYDVEYPRPSHLLAEASRVVRPGARIGILHFLVPASARAHLRLERVYGISQGCGYRIRAFTVFLKPNTGLFSEQEGQMPPSPMNPARPA